MQQGMSAFMDTFLYKKVMVNNGLVVFLIDNFVAVGIQRVDDEKGGLCVELLRISWMFVVM